MGDAGGGSPRPRVLPAPTGTAQPRGVRGSRPGCGRRSRRGGAGGFPEPGVAGGLRGAVRPELGGAG